MGGALKTLGGTWIFAGTAIDAGMLAIPLVTAVVGFPLDMLLLVICWAVMSLTALLILETNLAFPDGANFNIMSRHTIGRGGQLATWISFLLLLYALITAYVSGGASLLSVAVKLISGVTWPHWLISWSLRLFSVAWWCSALAL